jgi:hypothetical protein
MIAEGTSYTPSPQIASHFSQQAFDDSSLQNQVDLLFTVNPLSLSSALNNCNEVLVQ